MDNTLITLTTENNSRKLNDIYALQIESLNLILFVYDDFILIKIIHCVHFVKVVSKF